MVNPFFASLTLRTFVCIFAQFSAYYTQVLTFDHPSSVGLPFGADSIGVNSISGSDAGQQPSVQCPLLIELVVE